MRQAEVVRDTSETQIRIKINLDGTGKQKLATGVPFLDHMLDQIARAWVDRSRHRSAWRHAYR
jgi:imidazoleglycerol-phosphate dehydratase